VARILNVLNICEWLQPNKCELYNWSEDGGRSKHLKLGKTKDIAGCWIANGSQENSAEGMKTAWTWRQSSGGNCDRHSGAAN